MATATALLRYKSSLRRENEASLAIYNSPAIIRRSSPWIARARASPSLPRPPPTSAVYNVRRGSFVTLIASCWNAFNFSCPFLPQSRRRRRLKFLFARAFYAKEKIFHRRGPGSGKCFSFSLCGPLGAFFLPAARGVSSNFYAGQVHALDSQVKHARRDREGRERIEADDLINPRWTLLSAKFYLWSFEFSHFTVSPPAMRIAMIIRKYDIALSTLFTIFYYVLISRVPITKKVILSYFMGGQNGTKKILKLNCIVYSSKLYYSNVREFIGLYEV